MGESFQKRITALLLSNKRHARYVAMVACMAVAVVFGVTVGLTQEGQAKTHEEKVLDCQYSGGGAHTHDASCYDTDGNLVCTLAEREYHVHDDSCYASETHVICGMEEGEGAHAHDESCYDEEGNLVCGLEESAGHVHTDECYRTDTWLACGKEEVTEEHVHGEGCFKTIIVEDEPAEPAKAEEAKPAKAEGAKPATAESGDQTFTGELKDADGNVIVSVAVKAPKGALPDGATMRVKAVDEAAIKDKVDEAVKAEAGDNAVAKSITAVDIAFLDKDGNEVEPSKKVEVKITSAAVRDIEAPALVHIDEKTDTAEVVRDTAKVNADDKDTSTGNEDTLKFDTDQFSPYVIVETEELHGELLTGNGGVYDVVVTAGPEVGIPADAQLQVTELADTSDEYLAAFDEVVAQKKAEDESFDEASLGMAAFDITIVDVNGNTVEPLAPVNVTVNIAQLPAEATEAEATVELQHLDTSTGETVVETVATVADETLAIDGEAAVAEFELNSFSTFTLTWNNGQEVESAKILFGTMENGSFVEFDETTMSFDTTASSISLSNAHEDYLYTGSIYCEQGQSMEDGIDIESVLKKNAGGTWSYTPYLTDEDEGPAESQQVANGSTIYVTYTQEVLPSGASDDGVPSPTLTKTVTKNSDGTYTIQLDVTGETAEEDKSHYANVLIILDATQSMRGNKWTNAKAAMKALIETLTEGDNAQNAEKIDFALVTFGQSATVVQNWTKDNVLFKTTCANVNMVSTNGTNWEAGMRGGLYGVLNNKPDNDPTYVIFLTDGDPNRYYTNDNGTNYDTTGIAGDHSTSTAADRAKNEAKNIAAATKLYGIYCGDTGTTPSGASYNRLVSVITGSGQGGIKTIAANADTIESEFKAIAQTMIDEMGANNASVDDGVPSLSSISATVAGEASGFEYQISSDGINYSDWATAPGASYSNDNGVTWDLTAVGTLPEGTYYRLKFTVWPSQAAYDLVADLNNDLLNYGDDYTYTDSDGASHTLSGDEYMKFVKEASDGSYYMLTNTHLNMNYTYKDVDYSDPTDYTESAMPLPTQTISIKKVWNNPYDPTERPDGGKYIDLNVTKDGEEYLADDNAVRVTKEDGWTSTEPIYISCGMISQTGNSYTVKESGHDYAIVEPEEFAYHWDLTAATYHPMVINGERTVILILDENATGTDGTDYYVIGGKKYRVATESESLLTATNDRRSYLDLVKVVDDQSSDHGASEDEVFPFTCSFDNLDEDVYFSAYAGGYQEITGQGITKEMKDGEWTGYYYAPAATSFTINVKPNWSVRFTSLPKGTTYSFIEGDLSDGYEFEKAEGSSWNYSTGADQDYSITTSGSTVSGTIAESNHSYKVTVTNKYEPTNELTVEKVWASGDYVTEHGKITVALYRGDDLIDGTVQELNAPSWSYTYKNLSDLSNIVVRELKADSSTSDMTKIEPNGTIVVSHEKTTISDDADNTYVVTYSQGETTDGRRSDTVTNTLDKKELHIVKTNTDGSVKLTGAEFKLYSDAAHDKQVVSDADGASIGTSGTIVVDSTNGVKLGNLADGTYYLVETKAPDGYNMRTTDVVISIASGAVKADNVTVEGVDVDGVATYTFQVANSAGEALPMTGGPGTTLFTITGSAIIAVAVTYGIASRRRRERGLD